MTEAFGDRCRQIRQEPVGSIWRKVWCKQTQRITAQRQSAGSRMRAGRAHISESLVTHGRTCMLCVILRLCVGMGWTLDPAVRQRWILTEPEGSWCWGADWSGPRWTRGPGRRVWACWRRGWRCWCPGSRRCVRTRGDCAIRRAGSRSWDHGPEGKIPGGWADRGSWDCAQLLFWL